MLSIELHSALRGQFSLRQHRPFLIVTLLLLASATVTAAGQESPAQPSSVAAGTESSQAAQAQPSPANTMAEFEGKIVESVQLGRVPDHDREHLLALLAQKAGQPLDRDQVRDSMRALYATGRFADIQAEVAPSGEGVVLTFATSLNFFIGAVNVEGAPVRPNANQIINASKFQLGELHSMDKLDRALQNIRQLMQENGYYRARVTAESTSNASTQQVDVLFHVTPGEAAHIGEVTVTGSSGWSPAEVEKIAHMTPGDRVKGTRVTDALQHLRKRFQKQNRVLAQVEVAQQQYKPESNSVDYTFQIDPGPVVMISVQGFHISRHVLKEEIPVYEENALDDDLLNEGKSNLLDYLQTRGHFDAKVEIRKENDASTMHVIYQVNPGPRHTLAVLEITGITAQSYFGLEEVRSRLQIQRATRVSHGRFSDLLLKSDVATLESLYRSNGFRQVKIETKVDDNYQGVENRLAVHIHIEQGPQTLVGTFRIVGNHEIPTKEFPALETEAGQPYSEQKLASDRERILNHYFDDGFPNATLDIASDPSTKQPDRQDVTYTISEGERFTVNQVMVGGLDHTRSYVVDRELQVHKGEPLSQQGLLETQTKLYDLGIFSQVDTGVQNPQGTDPEKNVLIQAREAKRYTFTYGGGIEFETGLPAGASSPTGSTGVSPRVGFDVTRLNVGGRNQTLTFESHVGRLQQRGLISYEIPKLLNSDKFKLIFTTFYDNSLDVSTFTSQRLEGKIDLRQQLGKGTSITYRFDYRRVKASNFAADFSPAEVPLLSAPARVGGPGMTFIRDKRDNPLESTRGNYFTLDAFAASAYFGSEADFGRILAQYSTYYAFGGKGKTGHQFVFARSTTLGLEQPARGSRVLPPGACLATATNPDPCAPISIIPLPELFFAGGGNSHRGFGLNQAGPRDPTSGFPVGGTALFVNNFELRFPPMTVPLLGEGFGLAVFHDMGNVFTAPHDMIKGLGRWHQDSPPICAETATNGDCLGPFDNQGYDYTSQAVGVGIRYKTPIGPLRFDFGYNLNPTQYLQFFPGNTDLSPQRLRHFNVFFSIGQPF